MMYFFGRGESLISKLKKLGNELENINTIKSSDKEIGKALKIEKELYESFSKSSTLRSSEKQEILVYLQYSPFILNFFELLLSIPETAWAAQSQTESESEILYYSILRSLLKNQESSQELFKYLIKSKALERFSRVLIKRYLEVHSKSAQLSSSLGEILRLLLEYDEFYLHAPLDSLLKNCGEVFLNNNASSASDSLETLRAIFLVKASESKTSKSSSSKPSSEGREKGTPENVLRVEKLYRKEERHPIKDSMCKRIEGEFVNLYLKVLETDNYIQRYFLEFCNEFFKFCEESKLCKVSKEVYLNKDCIIKTMMNLENKKLGVAIINAYVFGFFLVSKHKEFNKDSEEPRKRIRLLVRNKERILSILKKMEESVEESRNDEKESEEIKSIYNGTKHALNELEELKKQF